MKKKFYLWSLAMLLLLPCVLRAEETEIQLMEVIEMTQIPGNDPLDDGEHMGSTPTRPRSFRATINGTSLSSKLYTIIMRRIVENFSNEI